MSTTENKEEDFASLFEDSFSEIQKMEPGQMVETEIVSISGGSVFLQLSGKSEGVLDIEEVTDKGRYNQCKGRGYY